jgi:hypothetical protein
MDGTILALQKSCKDLDFYQVKLICDKKPDNLPENIIWEYAPHIDTIDDFNYYMFLELGEHVDSSHMLFVHDHAFVLNGHLWDDSWLQWDYIGAGWPIVENAYIANNGERARQGNGGFSLRSSLILNLPKEKGWYLREEQNWKNEDGQCCVYWRKEMLENGIKYAPIEVASRFAFENVIPENVGIKPFGFHRNLPPW